MFPARAGVRRASAFAWTILLSAFLLFAVQPMIAKAILPWFGGAASVWITCLMFFQIALLLGYLYAHWLTSSVGPRRQALVHTALLAVSTLALPVIPSVHLKPSGMEDPAFRIVLVLALSVGLPFFLLSATSPLLQAWYARAHREAMPYRLYAVSNIGSMLALIAYPPVIERLSGTQWQLRGWSLGYAGFAALCAFVAFRSRTYDSVEVPAPETAVPERLGCRPYILWLVLPACASGLLMATTNHLIQNVAAIPFLWILPLSLYLLSFIICFDRSHWYRPGISRWIAALVLAAMCWGILSQAPKPNLKLVIPLFCAGLFALCMFCHGELVHTRPHPRFLTRFYVMIALGGAIGGAFVAVVAPRLFANHLEFPILLVCCAMLGLFLTFEAGLPVKIGWATVMAFLLLGTLSYTSPLPGTRVMLRNFYGTVRISDSGEGSEQSLLLFHGTILHGFQFLRPGGSRVPTAYFGRSSGIGTVITRLRPKRLRIGIIGLGAGTLAAYGEAGDSIRFYEINPLVERLARSDFRFLADCPAKLDVVLGDARLSIEREVSSEYDLLVVDAFSGDAIPVHLLTREAVQLYLRRLRPDGVLAMHITNTYLDLAPVVLRIAASLGLEAVVIDDPGTKEEHTSHSDWAIVSSKKGLQAAGLRQQTARPAQTAEVWSDDYSSLFRTLK